MILDPRLRKEESDDLLDDNELCDNLDEHMEQELLDEENEELEDDPWEKQVKMGQKGAGNQYSVW